MLKTDEIINPDQCHAVSQHLVPLILPSFIASFLSDPLTYSAASPVIMVKKTKIYIIKFLKGHRHLV